jgi:hypothetical protein
MPEIYKIPFSEFLRIRHTEQLSNAEKTKQFLSFPDVAEIGRAESPPDMPDRRSYMRLCVFGDGSYA